MRYFIYIRQIVFENENIIKSCLEATGKEASLVPQRKLFSQAIF